MKEKEDQKVVDMLEQIQNEGSVEDVEIPDTYYDVYYLKMIIDRIPDGTALSGSTTVRDIITSIMPGIRRNQ
jgi:hypothetical protein